MWWSSDYPVACSLPDYTTTEQVDDDSEVKSALGSPDITDISHPFSVVLIGKEVSIQKVDRNIRLVVAVSCDLVAMGASGPYPVVFHQSVYNTTFPDI